MGVDDNFCRDTRLFLCEQKSFSFVVFKAWLKPRGSYTIIGGVTVGAGWYLYRLAVGPSGELSNAGDCQVKVLTESFTCNSRLDESESYTVEHSRTRSGNEAARCQSEIR